MTRGGWRGGGRPKGTNYKMKSYRVTDQEDEIIKRWLKKRHSKPRD